MYNFNDGNIPNLNSNFESNLSNLDQQNGLKLFLGEVIDIINDSDHPDYTNTTDIGKVKFRLLTDSGKGSDNLSFALPINNSNINTPIIGELLVLFQIFDIYYFIATLNIDNTLNSQELKGISDSKTVKNKIKKENINKNTIIKQNPGDSILRGRYGNTILLSDLNKSPYILLASDDNFDLSNLDNINNCILITKSGLISQFNSRMRNSQLYNKDGAINSDKNIILIKNDTLITESTNFLNNSTNYTQNSEKTIINTPSYILNSNETNIKSKKITLGNSASNSVVLGEELNQVLNDLIDAITKITVMVPSAPGKSLPPVNIPDFIRIKGRLQRILSKSVKTE